ncbi:hypothetical protein PMAYCL1PPCAC_03522, partial [Pristionchus mayeri]
KNAGCGRIFSPKTANLSARIVNKYLPHRAVPSILHSHETVGKICRKRNGRYRIDATLRVRGLPLKRPATTLTPRTAKKAMFQLMHQPSVPLAVTRFDVTIDSPYPAWSGQSEGIAAKAFGDVERIEREIPPVWKEWTVEAVMAYLSYSPSSSPSFFFSTAASTRPPWRGALPRMNDELSHHLKVLDTIRRDFFTKWRPQLLFDAEEFFHTEKARPAEDFHSLLRQFVDKAKTILQSKWPLRVGRILLNEAACWVHLLTRGDEARRFLDSVASTQAKLLVDLLRENYESIYRFMYEEASNAKLSVIVNESGDTVFGKEDMLLELTRLPRVDGKIYPKLFGEEWIDVGAWLRVERPLPPDTPRPFEDSAIQIDPVELRLKEWCLRDEEGREEEELKEWIEIVKSLFEVESRIKKCASRRREASILFDFSLVKQRALDQLKKLREKAREAYLERQSMRNERMRIIFSTASTKLFGKGVIEQLSQVSEVQAILDPLELSVSHAVTVYLTMIDYYDLPDSTLRHCYEISRLGSKLRQLTEFVWRRIDLEREWVSKRVQDESHALFFEAELLEKELESCLHKYRNCHSLSQLQRVASRIEEIAEKTKKLHAKCEVMWIQRRLLNLDEMCLEVPTLAKQASLIAMLARLHYDTLSTEEDCLNSRVFDLDKDAVAAAHHRLEESFEEFEPQIALIERESALSITQVAVDSIKTSLGKLAHLLPILNAIANRNMRSHHWQMVMAADGAALNENPPVSSLLEFNILEKAEVFEEVGVIADKELIVEKSMQGMKNELAATRLQPKAPVEDWIDLRSMLGTQAARCRTLLASLPPADLASQLREWMETVESLAEFVDCYVKCSRSWKHVEGVFATEDIAYQMPTEFWTFTRIRQLWQQLNQVIADQPILSHLSSVQQMSTQLQQLLGLFDNVEAGFNSYLQKKRTAFPRLHLLSHSELLDLLSQSREPSSVSSFIHLLFTKIKAFVMNGRGELTHLRSVHDELYALTTMVNASIYKHHVEKWLVELERESAKSLRDQIKKCIDTCGLSYPAAAKMVDEPEQVVELYVQVVTTHVVEKAIKMNALKKLLEYLDAAVKEVSTNLREKRPKLTKRLCEIIASKQTVAKALLKRQVKLTDDEIWTRELRIYWNNEQVFVRVYRSVVRFDYELLGSSQRSLPSGGSDFVRAAIRAGIEHVPLAVVDDLGAVEEAVIELARTLGRPLVLPRREEIFRHDQQWMAADETPEQRRKALAKAALLIGGVVLLDVSTLHPEDLGQINAVLYEMRRELAPNEQLRCRVDESELVVSRSALIVFVVSKPSLSSSLALLDCSARRFFLNDDSTNDQMAALLRAHAVQDYEKIAIDACLDVDVIREIVAWRPHYARALDWRRALGPAIVKLAGNFENMKERQSLIGRALTAAVLPSLALEDRILLSRLFSFTTNSSHPDRILLTSLSSHGNHSPFVAKCLELSTMLSESLVMIVLGPPMAGKTTLIDAARALVESKEITVDLFVFHSDVPSFETFLKAKLKHPPPSDGHSEMWVVLDAPPPERIMQWMEELASNESAITLPSHMRIILETDVVVRSSPLPLIYVDWDTVPQSILTPSMTSLLKTFGILNQRELFSMRKMLIEKAIKQGDSPLKEAFIHFIVLQSLLPVYVVRDRFSALMSPLPLSVLLTRFPVPNEEFIELVQDIYGPPPALFFARLLTLLLESSLIPVITAAPRHAATLASASAVLEKNFAVFEVSIDSDVSTVDHVRVALHACQLLAGEDDLLTLDPLLIVHFPSPILAIELQECLRCFAYTQKNTKLALLYTASPSLPVSDIVPPRMEALAIPVNAELAQLDLDQPDVPLVLDLLLHGLRPEAKRVAAAEWRDALGPAALTTHAKVAAYLESIIGSGAPPAANLAVRDGYSRELPALAEEYCKLASDLPDPLMLTDSSTPSVCLLEKALEKRTSAVFIGCRGSGRRPTVAFAAHLVGFSIDQIHPKISAKEWEELLEKTLRACILDGAKIVIFMHELIHDAGMRRRIIADALPLVRGSALPARLLTHQLLCQVSDKYSIGGGALWPEMRKRLGDSLAFLVEDCALLWTSEVNSTSLRQSARSLLEASKMFTQTKIDTMLDALCKTQSVLIEEKLTGMDAKFIEFVRTFIVLVKDKKQRVEVVIKRYEKGMEKLRKAEEQIGFLQGELLRLQPELVRTSIETSMLMSSIERESIEVENAREVVAANEHKANEAATKAQALKVESEEDLANALPSLEAAVDALETMKQSDISSLKTMRYPPYGVRICMEAVCILLGESPTRIPNPMGEASIDYWPTGQRLLSDIHFLSRIRNFPRDSVPKKTMAIIREKYLSKDDFDPEKVKQ